MLILKSLNFFFQIFEDFKMNFFNLKLPFKIILKLRLIRIKKILNQKTSKLEQTEVRLNQQIIEKIIFQKKKTKINSKTN